MNMKTAIRTTLRLQLLSALWECCPPDYINLVTNTLILDDIVQELMEDVEAFASKDPAAGGDPLRIVQSYTSFKAVLHYRLAHKLDQHFYAGEFQYSDLKMYAALISGRGKILSGAELHHSCRIGKRFILDHGIGTVFGETTDIGDDCYVLGGVTLGASGISNNPNGKRHPTIGNRVQIGAYARIFGVVTVGDDVIIGPQCTITKDVSRFSKVLLRTSVQVVNLPTPHAVFESYSYGATINEISSLHSVSQ
jgi:serine O-acetyltransferase